MMLRPLLTAISVGMDERLPGSVFQIFDATDENDLEVAMEVLRKGTHILTRMKKIGVIAQVHRSHRRIDRTDA